MITQETIERRPLSASSLKAFRRSPKHYVQYLTQPYEQSDAMIFGSAVDCLLLTPELFDKRFIPIGEINRRTKEGKAEWENMLATAQINKQALIKQSDIDRAKLCVESLMSHDEARILIEAKTKVQVKLEWRDKRRNLPLIGYPDFESRAWGEDIVVDLKTTRSADPDDFNRQAAQLDYELQCGAYLEGYRKTKYRFPMFFFLAVESEEPYNVSLMFADADYESRARAEFDGTLSDFRHCLGNGMFNQGYKFRVAQGEYFSMKIPAYKKPKFEHFQNLDQ